MLDTVEQIKHEGDFITTGLSLEGGGREIR
jgi:hypothetical protein